MILPIPFPHGQAEVIAKYGKPWEDATPNHQRWASEWIKPAVIGEHFLHLNHHGIIYVNRDIVPDVEIIFSEIAKANLAQELHSFDGCWNVRPIRGTADTWSVHTWALALDLDAATNPLGQPATMHAGIVTIFRDHGWEWGGNFHRIDGMHFQRATGI